jgi:hypothetical protein
MGYKDPTYVIFDGDEDGWAYRFMRGWKANDNIDFDFRDAHDLDNMTSRAQSEEYVKRQLRERMRQSKSVLILVGEKTKNLYRFVRWEIELALELGLPIIVVNLNEKRQQDDVLCPPLMRGKCAVHIPFKLKIIQKALDAWPPEFARLTMEQKASGPRYYAADIYQGLGL